MNYCKKQLLRFFVLSGLTLSSYQLFAQGETLPSRLFIWGAGGTRLFGESDVMIPFLGDSNHSLFIDLTGKYGNNNAWLGSVGIGNRSILAETSILGAYLFWDYNRTPSRNNFPVINPGIEGMTPFWDVHLNGYIPIKNKSDSLGEFTGNQLGIPDTTFFSGHRQYEQLFNLFENVGPGGDIEIGRTIFSFNQARVFGGGYYFNPKYSSSIRGAEAGIEMPLKYRGMEVGILDTYDNINHNTIALRLRIKFGGLPKSEGPDIHDRMLDLIPRHLGSLPSGDGIPSEKSFVNTGRMLVKDNIWFFNSTGVLSTVEGLQSCTFERPCIGLAQAQIDTIQTLAPNANFYLSSGTYNNPGVGSGFRFYNGQNIMGRTSNFTQLATGDSRPLLNDSLLLEGNNEVYNLRVVANSELDLNTAGMSIPVRAGILVTTSATGPVNIYNTDVTSTATIFNAAAIINNSPTTTLNINNSTFTTTSQNIAGSLALGAANVSSGTININASSITVNQMDVGGFFNLAFGVVNNENGIINIANTTIAVNATNVGLAAGVLNNSTVGSGTVNITDSTVAVVAENTSLAGAIFNQANNVSGIGGTVNINGSSLFMTSNNNGGGLGAAVLNSGESTVNINQSIIESTGNQGAILGLLNSDPLSTATLQNTSIYLNLEGTAVGNPIINSGTLNDNGGNQCFRNGVPEPC